MKRTLPHLSLHALLVLATSSLCATAAFAATRCSDDPESCVKSASKVSRPAVQLATNAAHASAPAPVQAAPAATAKKPAVVAKKPAAKPKPVAPRTSSPTPGMGMLLKLSNGSGGDISWAPGKAPETPGQSWVL